MQYSRNAKAASICEIQDNFSSVPALKAWWCNSNDDSITEMIVVILIILKNLGRILIFCVLCPEQISLRKKAWLGLGEGDNKL